LISFPKKFVPCDDPKNAIIATGTLNVGELTGAGKFGDHALGSVRRLSRPKNSQHMKRWKPRPREEQKRCVGDLGAVGLAAALPRNPSGPWHVRGCDRPVLLSVSTFSHRYAATIGYFSCREVSCRIYCTEQKAAAASRKKYQRSPSARPNTNSGGNFRARGQVGLIALAGSLWARVLRGVRITVFGKFAFFRNRTDRDRGKRKWIAGCGAIIKVTAFR
jgi:hypothetical protein